MRAIVIEVGSKRSSAVLGDGRFTKAASGDCSSHILVCCSFASRLCPPPNSKCIFIVTCQTSHRTRVCSTNVFFATSGNKILLRNRNDSFYTLLEFNHQDSKTRKNQQKFSMPIIGHN